MTGTQFSRDSARAGPGRKVTGQGERRIDREQRRSAPKPGPGQAQGRPAASHGEGQHLGFPQGPQSDSEQSPDLRHVQLLSQHLNMQGLGREALFGNRVSINGEYRQILGAGQVPFDILEDL